MGNNLISLNVYFYINFFYIRIYSRCGATHIIIVFLHFTSIHVFHCVFVLSYILIYLIFQFEFNIFNLNLFKFEIENKICLQKKSIKYVVSF